MRKVARKLDLFSLVVERVSCYDYKVSGAEKTPSAGKARPTLDPVVIRSPTHRHTHEHARAHTHAQRIARERGRREGGREGGRVEGKEREWRERSHQRSCVFKAAVVFCKKGVNRHLLRNINGHELL